MGRVLRARDSVNVLGLTFAERTVIPGSLSWAFLTRAGSEIDLIEELDLLGTPAEAIGEAIVLADRRPRANDGSLVEPAFARQAMRTDANRGEMDPELLADQLMKLLRRKQVKDETRWNFQISLPDSKDPKDIRRRWADEAGPMVQEAIEARISPELRARQVPAEEAELLLQVWPVDDTGTILGLTEANLVLSRAPGGRRRLRRPDDAPSRAGLKLEEAIAWAGVGPSKGDRCVDLGAAPGGWTQVAIGRGAHVLAIDPARIKMEFPAKKFTHLQASAFEYAPDEALDWLLCDMAWRPLEVARLLAKWARRGWARQLISNIKLPMKKKAKILGQVMQILEDGGWRGLKARQLYYDRDEVTLFAWLDPSLSRQGVKAPFAMRNQQRKNEGPRGRKPSKSGGPRGRGKNRPKARKKPRQKSLKRR